MSHRSDRTDMLVVGFLGVSMAAGALAWLTGEMTALLSSGRWPAVSPATGIGVLARLPGTIGRPSQAWPAKVRNELPVAVWWYAASAALCFVAAVGLAAAAWAAVRVGREMAGGGGPRRGFRPPNHRSRAGRGRRPVSRRSLFPSLSPPPPPSLLRNPTAAPLGGGAYWADRRHIGGLRVRHPHGDRMVLGRVGRRLVATEARHSVLVLGPTQSGKTSALAIPALLEWQGPVIATSVKDDLVAHTRGYRDSLGLTWVFDPTAAVRGARRAGWSPLAEASTWSGAQRVAKALVDAAPAPGGLTDGAFWYQAAAKLLAPLVRAAEVGSRSMADVVRWTNLQQTEEVQLLLELAGESDAVAALAAGQNRDDRIRSSVYTTLETVLAPYEDPVVAASAQRRDIDPDTLLAGRNTLYLCGPTHEQARVQGVFSALVAAVVHAAVRRYEHHGPLDPPLLVLLDEVANIAPFRDLDTLASTGAGMGIQLMTICQDLAQLSNRYGPERARTITNNHRAKVALSGIADIATLDTLSALAGEAAVREQTVTADFRDGRRSTSTATSTAYRRLAPADELRRIRPGAGLLIYGYLPPARLVLRPWYRDGDLRRREEMAAPCVTADGPSTRCA